MYTVITVWTQLKALVDFARPLFVNASLTEGQVIYFNQQGYPERIITLYLNSQQFIIVY